MPFSPKIRSEVKKRALFRCCRCWEIGIQVHHIIPEGEGGSSTDIDNAAPLCPNCHDLIGPNPKKRKEIREMRDFWYEHVKNNILPNLPNVILNSSENINTLVLNSQKEEVLQELKDILISLFEKVDISFLATVQPYEQIAGLTPESSATVATDILYMSHPDYLDTWPGVKEKSRRIWPTGEGDTIVTVPPVESSQPTSANGRGVNIALKRSLSVDPSSSNGDEEA